MEPADKTILLVDDEEPNRKLLTRRLSNLGYDVTSVEGGRQALEALRSSRFDLILLDLMMPEVDGLATLDAIKSDPALDGIPVVMLTASNTRESIVHCLSLGASDYLIKPVDPIELKRRVERLLMPPGPAAPPRQP